MNEPKVFINDPRAINSPRKMELASRIESIIEEGEEFARRRRAKPKPKSKRIPSAKVEREALEKKIRKAGEGHSHDFDEKKHPRDSTGRFTKKPVDLEGRALKPGSYKPPAAKWPPGDVRNNLIVQGDQGFNDVLVGLAAGAIFEVHDFPPGMKQITFSQIDLGSIRGLYMPDRPGRDGGIEVNTNGKGRALTAIHEIGHFLDYRTDKSKHLTEDKDLWTALFKSDIYQKIMAVRDDPKTDEDTKDSAKYLLTPTEVFARAYTQYVVSRSSNKTLKAEFKERQEQEGTHWSDKDFEAIGKQFDRIFKTKKKKKR